MPAVKATTIPSPRDPRLNAWRTFLYAHAQVRRQLERELQAEQSMGLAEYEVLLILAYSEGRRLRMSDLADSLALSRSGATRLIDRLEAVALVERVSCDTDRRGQWAQLTDAGYARLRAASPTHLRGVAEHFLDRIPARELESLRSTLERVLVTPS
jgi:DNA-binding MarR family transcriptional regulator